MTLQTLSTLAVLTLILSLHLPQAEGSPRRQRDFSFPQNENLAPEYEIVQQSDGETLRRSEQAAAIRRESRPSPALTRRPEGETYTQYRERIEAARQRLEADGLREEDLKAEQREELYRTLYALRRETFAGSHSPHGHGAGPGGERHQPPLDLVRLYDTLKTTPEPEAADEADAESGK